MKTYFLILIILTVLCQTPQAQNSNQLEVIDYNELKFQGAIQGYPTQYQTRIVAGANYTQGSYYNEIEDVTMQVYNYGNCALRYLDGAMKDFVLKDSSIYFTIRGTRLQVGKNISTLSSAFPVAYANKSQNQMELWFGNVTTGEVYYSSIRIVYDSNGIITEIEKWSAS